jgi:hypothetical protein
MARNPRLSFSSVDQMRRGLPVLEAEEEEEGWEIAGRPPLRRRPAGASAESAHQTVGRARHGDWRARSREVLRRAEGRGRTAAGEEPALSQARSRSQPTPEQSSSEHPTPRPAPEPESAAAARPETKPETSKMPEWDQGEQAGRPGSGAGE